MLGNLLIFTAFIIVAYIFLLPLLNVIDTLRFKRKDKLLLYPVALKNHTYFFLLTLFGFAILYLIVHSETTIDCLLKISAIVLIVCHHYISTPDRHDILEANDLNIGYGAALWYYKNYLSEFLHSNLVERIKNFESENDVKVLQTLFLLVPNSCVVPQNIDFEDEQDCIERCQELKEFKKTNAGIKDRVYNCTVYLLRTGYGNKRMVIEYAQPCKGLYALKSKNIYTEREMARQRQLFVNSLQKLLHDENNSYKYCKIIQFDDKKQKVSEALIQHCF